MSKFTETIETFEKLGAALKAQLPSSCPRILLEAPDLALGLFAYAVREAANNDQVPELHALEHDD